MKRLPDGYWSYERCRAEALKYKTRRDFRAASHAYFKASQKGWLQEICQHMERLGNISHRFVYVIVDPVEQTVYVGLTCNPKRREKDHRRVGPAVQMFRNGATLEVISGLLTSAEAAELEIQTVQEFRDAGLAVLNSMKGGGLGGKTVWTLGTCRSEAAKYSTRSEFARGSSGAYTAAGANGWLDAVCGHMPRRKPMPLRRWSEAKVRAEAAKYQTRSEFARASWGAYQCACKQGWLEAACQHMGAPRPGRRPTAKTLGPAEAEELAGRVALDLAG